PTLGCATSSTGCRNGCAPPCCCTTTPTCRSTTSTPSCICLSARSSGDCTRPERCCARSWSEPMPSPDLLPRGRTLTTAAPPPLDDVLAGARRRRRRQAGAVGAAVLAVAGSGVIVLAQGSLGPVVGPNHRMTAYDPARPCNGSGPSPATGWCSYYVGATAGRVGQSVVLATNVCRLPGQGAGVLQSTTGQQADFSVGLK